MTGNTSKWRAPLAGLASIAMLATMGVAASTANALSVAQSAGDSAFTANVGNLKSATAKVKLYTAAKPYESFAEFTEKYGQALSAEDVTTAANAGNKSYGVLDYLSFDKAGANKVATPYVVTGDVKLFAHFKDSVKVSFDVNGDKTPDYSVNIAKGTGLTADDYDLAVPPTSGYNRLDDTTVEGKVTTTKTGYKFVGWTTEYTKDNSTSDALYTGEALNADTVLYPRWAKDETSGVNTGKDLARVDFYDSVDDQVGKDLYTLNGYAFPAFRAPQGSWKAEGKLDTAYDFSTPVYNRDGNANTTDLTLFNYAGADSQNVTVKFDMNSDQARNGSSGPNVQYTPSEVTTTSDKTIAEPTAPVYPGAVFTGWYLQKDWATGESRPFDFSKSVNDNFKSAKGVVTLYAGWDTTNVSELVFNLDYADWTAEGEKAQQVLFVHPNTTVQLPNGWEEYYQTADQDNAAKGEFTAKKLAGWYIGDPGNGNTVTSFTANTAESVTSFTAKWTGSSSIKLVANGGHFDGNATTKWVTKDDGQKWSDVVVEPTSDQGGKFVQWRNNEAVYVNRTKIADEGKLIANLSDGYWYTIKTENGQAVKDKPATYTVAGKTYNVVIADGAALKAEWDLTSRVDIQGYRNQFKLLFGSSNEAQDVLTVAAYGYTDASAKAYVKAVNALEDEYAAYKALPEGQAKIDAANALAPKYEAAQALLVKSNGAEVPDGKVAVYRAFNPNETRGGSHLYTTSYAEYQSVVRAGWRAEGVQFQTTTDKNAEPVYRAYNPNDGSHFYTLSKVELDHAVKAGWKYEGKAWYVAKDASDDVLRIYNPNSGEHVFTLSKVEANAAVKAGWNDEGVAFKAYAK